MTDTNDQWDDAGPFLYRHMPEDSLLAFFTEERDMIQITPEQGGFWLTTTGSQGAVRYDTLAEAKTAGDAELDKLERTQDATLLDEAGLSGEIWTISYADGLTFEAIRHDVVIVADTNELQTSEKWRVYVSENDPGRTVHRIADAVAIATRQLQQMA